ncbi:MAG: matrixin family metalloprotease [Bacteroidota bacterium]|nr:matrixin family metalloprotease [Bacteroidota bacterium]
MPIKKFSITYLLLCLVLILSSCGSQESKQTEVDEEKEATNKASEIKKNSVIIDIQPYEGLPKEITEHIFSELKKIHPNVSLLSTIALPQRAFYKPRGRYRADTLIDMLRNKTPNGHVTIGLTNKDISTSSGKHFDWGVMGLGFQPGKACVASTFRLSKTNTKEQFFKVAIHELGHTQGLPHCPNTQCIMTDAEGKNKTDNEKGFCSKCKAVLVNKGFDLSKLSL